MTPRHGPRFTWLPASLAALLLPAFCPTPVHAAPPGGAAVLSAAPRCAATAEAAARGIVGAPATQQTASGYRVQDLFVDPVLRKAYVRVVDCQDSRKPLTLVALDVQLPGVFAEATATVPSVNTPLAQTAAAYQQSHTVPSAQPVLLRRGDPVEIVLQSSNVHMTLHGHAAQPAALNASVDIVLDSVPGTTEPAHHMQGIAAGPGKVEVTQ